MRHILISWLLLLLLGTEANAATYTISGQVALLRSHDAALGLDWFSLAGASSAGACGTYGGAVVMRLRDDARGQRQFSMLLAAKMSGTAVQVTLDDSVVDGYGHCYVRYLDVI